MADGILVNQGTQTRVAAVENGTVQYPFVKLDVGVGSAVQNWNGTVPTVGNLNSGTITALAKGTVSAGTVDVMKAGTIDSISQFPPNPWQATVTTGTNTLGTIKAAVAGSAIFVTDLIISAGSATTVVIGMGGTSTPFIGTLSFAQYGGLAMPFKIPGSVTSGSALVYQQSAAISTLSIYAAGFVR